MRQKVSDYIADFLINHDITRMFSVVGGGAMHLNDSFGHRPGLKVTYNHHEQASAMAAEAYARVNNKIAAVCVTTGPGATNAITGVVGGWMDSIPMLIFSGQVRYATSVYASGLPLRTRGVQEFDIVGSVANMTKYCELIVNPADIRYCLEKALHLAVSGRPGPCWLDIPLDVQGAYIETEELRGYMPELKETKEIPDSVLEDVIRRIRESERPILFAGNGVRLAGAHELFLQLVEKLNIPVVTGMSSVDAIASDYRLYVGRNGTTGDRAGNFAIQNCDLLFSLGSRLSFFQTGFQYQTWARAAYKIVNDIDCFELEKDSINADCKLCCDVGALIKRLLEKLPGSLPEKTVWTRRCRDWKSRYPVVQDKHFRDPLPNIYVFCREMSRKLSSDDAIVVGVGTARVASSQACVIKEGMRFYANASCASMGYCLPAAIGVCIAREKQRTVLVTGEGSLQMNLQELQTIVQNRLPIVIFVLNNQGYHSIRMTQRTYFSGPPVGLGPESGDVSFPDLQRIASAYGLAFLRCADASRLDEFLHQALSQEGPCICELMMSAEQVTEPKVSSKKLENGQMISAPLEDMAPFLPREEFYNNMLIEPLKEQP